MSGAGFVIRPWRDGDQESALALIGACYGPDAAQKSRWMHWHFGLPGVKSGTMVAEAGDALIGMQPLELHRHRFRGRPMLAGVLTGVMVHPDWRRRGVFRRLILACESRAWELGAELLTTMPNELSRPGFIGLQWSDPGERRLLAWIARPDRVLSERWPAAVRRLAGPIARVVAGRSVEGARSIEVLPVASFDESVSRAVERHAAGFPGLVQERSVDWLKWRYDDGAPVRYGRLLAKRRGGEVCGLAVTARERREGREAGYVVDLVADSDDAARTLVGGCLERLRGEGAEVVLSAVSCRPLVRAMRGAGMVLVPGRIAPKRFYTVFRPRPGAEQTLRGLERIESWYQTLGDWDNL